MNFPAVVYGILIAGLYGSLFHIWMGGGINRYILYLFLAQAGFWLGHFGANYMNWTVGSVGALRMLPATLVCLVVLVLGHWLSFLEPDLK